MSYNNSSRNNGGYYNSRYNPSKKYNNNNGMNGQSDGGYGGGPYSGNSSNSRRNEYGGYNNSRYNKYPSSGSMGGSSYSSKGSYYSNGNGGSGYGRKHDRYDNYSRGAVEPSSSNSTPINSGNSNYNRQSSSYGSDRRSGRDQKYENASYVDDRRAENRDSYGRSHKSLTPEQYSNNGGYTSDRRARSDEPRYDYKKQYPKLVEGNSRDYDASYFSGNTQKEKENKETNVNEDKSQIPSNGSISSNLRVEDSKASNDVDTLSKENVKQTNILKERTDPKTAPSFKSEGLTSEAPGSISITVQVDPSDDNSNINTEEKKNQQEEKQIDNQEKSDIEPDTGAKSPQQSSHNIADSSMLSPIGDSDQIDDTFFKNLDTINESKKENKVDIEEDLSEAETIITNSPPRFNKSRRLVRKKDFDEERRKIKRRTIISSEDEEDGEEDSSEEGSHKSSNYERKNMNERPYKLKRDSSGRSLLQRACKKGNIEDIKSYLKRGANANESDFCGFTCLHEAALEGHVDVVEILLQNGADINAQADENGYYETPLMDAAENKHEETVQLLISKGANPNIYNIDGFTALTKIYNEHKDEEGYDEIIKMLEEAGNKFAVAPSHEKLEEVDSTNPDTVGPKEIVEDPNNSYFSEIIRKKNIYKFAAEGAKEITANYFVAGNSLESKPDILILAARNGHTELVDIILGLSLGPHNVDIENDRGLTPLLASVGRGHYEVVESLLVKGADPTKIRRNDQLSCLEIAQRSAHYSSKEVELIQNYIDKRNDTSKRIEGKEAVVTTNNNAYFAKTNDASDIRNGKMKENSDEEIDNGIENEERDEEQDEDEEYEEKVVTKRKRSEEEEEDEDKDTKKQKSEIKVRPLPSKVFNKEETPDRSEFKNKEESFSPSSIRPDFKSESPQSPAPLTKEQEELKAKNAEEARIWQQKVEAKKRARKDMFLKSEKEKERRRREEEEKKLEEQKKLAIIQEERALKLAEVKQQKTQQLQEERKSLQQKMILESYPIGLPFVKFGSLTKDEMLKYAPLYLFDIKSEVYVIDLQFAFISGLTIPDMSKKMTSLSKIVLSNDDKSKVWPLFFPMIGIDPTKPTVNLNMALKDGHDKFQNLYISFVKYEFLAGYTEKQLPETYSTFFCKENTVHVNYDSLIPYTIQNKCADNDANLLIDDVNLQIATKDIEKVSFVPPNLKRRKDIINTIYSAHTPLW